MDAEVLKATYDFAVNVLKILVTVFVPLIWSFVDSRFGWRAKVKRDVEAYQMLGELAGDYPTNGQLRVLAVLKYRAFDIAEKSMEPNRYAGGFLYLAAAVNFSMGILVICDFISSGRIEWIHSANTFLYIPSVALIVVALLWYYIDSVRAIDAIGYEIEFNKDEMNKRVNEGEAFNKELQETYMLLKECYKRKVIKDGGSEKESDDDPSN